MRNNARPEFYGHIDDALSNRDQLAAAMEAIAWEINPKHFPREITRLLTILRSSPKAEQMVQDGFNAAFLPVILRGCPPGEALNLCRIVGDVFFAEEARKNRWRGILYPLFVIAAALLIFVLLAVTILPTFQKMFSEFELKLPYATRILLRISDLISHSPGYFCLSLLGVGIAGLGLRKLMTLIYPHLEASSSLGPLVSGNTSSVAAMGRFASTLAELLCIGTPLDQAISIAGRASQNLRIKIASDQMAIDIGTKGKFQADSNVAHNFPLLIRHALEAGPNGAPSIPLLRQVSALYFERVRHRLDWAAGLFAPLAIVGVGLLVAFIVIALFMPLISLITSLSG
jgi:type IV pilus assembly protein PilC